MVYKLWNESENIVFTWVTKVFKKNLIIISLFLVFNFKWFQFFEEEEKINFIIKIDSLPCFRRRKNITTLLF